MTAKEWLVYTSIILLVSILLFLSYAILGLMTTFAVIFFLFLFYVIILKVMSEER